MVLSGMYSHVTNASKWDTSIVLAVIFTGIVVVFCITH